MFTSLFSLFYITGEYSQVLIPKQSPIFLAELHAHSFIYNPGKSKFYDQ